MDEFEFTDEPVETGLLASRIYGQPDKVAKVTVKETPIAADKFSPLPPVAVVPVPPAQPGAPVSASMPDGWTLHTVAALVSDVAQNMYELPYILAKHKLTAKQYATLEKNQFFQRALEAEIITWSGANSIQKRLMLEAAISVERAMPTVAARMQNATEPLEAIVPLMKVFAEMAGVIGTKAVSGPQAFGDRFKIIINMGGTKTETEATPSIKVNTIEHVA